MSDAVPLAEVDLIADAIYQDVRILDDLKRRNRLAEEELAADIERREAQLAALLGPGGVAITLDGMQGTPVERAAGKPSLRPAGITAAAEVLSDLGLIERVWSRPKVADLRARRRAIEAAGHHYESLVTEPPRRPGIRWSRPSGES